jgi:ATP-dependent RNA helicase DHX37/DHR1
MGRQKRGYNSQARTNVSGSVDNSETLKLATKIEGLPNHQDEKMEQSLETSNALVLPSKKRKFKAEKSENVGKILSRKRRKYLEKVVEKKKKKEERGDLLKKLAEVQADPKMLDRLVSLSSVQTKGLKRQFAEDQWAETMAKAGISLEKVVVENDEFANVEMPKKIKLKKPKKVREIIGENDPNVLGFNQDSESDVSSESESSDSDQEEEIIETIIKKSDEKESEIESSEKVVTTKNVEIKPKLTPEEPADQKTVFVPVQRSPEVDTARSKLPIIAEEHLIMDAIRHNDVVIVAGETGSGKTTQVPQFLYEAGYATEGKMIGITEPRRVAAIAMASRVGHEMNMKDLVSYQIRFDDKTSEKTRYFFNKNSRLQPIICYYGGKTIAYFPSKDFAVI